MIDRIQGMQVEPGDVIVVRTHQKLSKDARDRLRLEIRDYFPGHQILVLTEGIEITTMTKRTQEQEKAA